MMMMMMMLLRLDAPAVYTCTKSNKTKWNAEGVVSLGRGLDPPCDPVWDFLVRPHGDIPTVLIPLVHIRPSISCWMHQWDVHGSQVFSALQSHTALSLSMPLALTAI